MDRDLVRRWKEGHALAPARTAAEARARPLAARVDDLVRLERAARALGWRATDERQVEVVRARFARLHAKLGVSR